MTNREPEDSGNMHPDDAIAHQIYRKLCEAEGIEPYTNKDKTVERVRTAQEERLDAIHSFMERINTRH